MGKLNNKRAVKENTKEYHQNICRNIIADVKVIMGQVASLKGYQRNEQSRATLDGVLPK